MTRNTKRTRLATGRRASTDGSRARYLELPETTIEKLVWDITLHEDAEIFIRRMVIVMDTLKAGNAAAIERMTRQTGRPRYKQLMKAIFKGATSGRLTAAHNTAFYAAHYAYRDSLEYARALLGYMDSLRKG
jgi:hypothetical protein